MDRSFAVVCNALPSSAPSSRPFTRALVRLPRFDPFADSDDGAGRACDVAISMTFSGSRRVALVVDAVRTAMVMSGGRTVETVIREMIIRIATVTRIGSQ